LSLKDQPKEKNPARVGDNVQQPRSSIHAVYKRLTGSPLDNWGNKDVVQTQESMDYLKGQFGSVAELFEWNDMQQFFLKHESVTKPARMLSQSRGVKVVALGTLSLCAVSISPLFDQNSFFVWLAGGVAAVLSGLGILFGFVQSKANEAKRAWLTNRFATERARQFKFQFLLANLSEAIDAVKGGEDLQKYFKLRQRAFEDFDKRYMDEDSYEYSLVMADDAHARTWMLPKPSTRLPAGSAQKKDLQLILDAFKVLRIDVQLSYVRHKVKPGFQSPVTRYKVLNSLGNVMTLFAMISTFVAGLTFLFLRDQSSSIALFALAMGACFAAIVTAIRVLVDGFGVRVEAARYQWYQAVLESIEQRYISATPNEKVRLLHEFEQTVYKEMRGFLISQTQSNFIFR